MTTALLAPTSKERHYCTGAILGHGEWFTMPNSVVVRSQVGLENDPQSSTDTTSPGGCEGNQPAVLMWRSANTFTNGTVNSPADFSDKLSRHALLGTCLCEHI